MRGGNHGTRNVVLADPRAGIRATSVAAPMLGSVLASAALPNVPVASATSGNGFGCDIDAQKPSVQDGEVIGHTAIDCGPWGWSGRTVRVEVWQKDDDGTWQPLHTSITDWLGMDQPDVDQQIDGAGFWRKNLNGDNTRKDQTRVFVGDGTGPETDVASATQELGRNCLADSAALDPATVPDDAEVDAATVEPAGATQFILKTCNAVVFEPNVNNGFVEGKVRWVCNPLNWRDVRTVTVKLMRRSLYNDGHVVQEKTVRWTDRGPKDGWSFALFASCRKDAATRLRWSTEARAEYKDGNGPNSGNQKGASRTVWLNAACFQA